MLHCFAARAREGLSKSDPQGLRGTERPRPLRKKGSHTAPRLCGDIEASFRRLTPRRWHRPAREGHACLTR